MFVRNKGPIWGLLGFIVVLLKRFFEFWNGLISILQKQGWGHHNFKSLLIRNVAAD